MRIHVFNVAISTISTSRLAGEGDIKQILGVEDIPEALKPILRQSILPTDAVNPLYKQRGRARSLLLKYASRSELFGWIINPGAQRELLENLEQIKTDFYQAKANLLQNYESYKQAQLDKLREECDGYEHIDAVIAVVRKEQPSIGYLEERLSFEYLHPKTIEILREEESIVRNGVLGSALHEISKRSEQAVSLETPKAKLDTLDEIVKKVDGLGYIAPPLHRIADEIRHILSGVPRGIRNIDYHPIYVMAINHVLMRISDPSFPDIVSAGDTLFHVDAPPSQDMLVNLENVGQTVSGDTPSHNDPVQPVEEHRVYSDDTTEEAIVW